MFLCQTSMYTILYLFLRVPSSPFSYWIDNKIRNLFSAENVSKIILGEQKGVSTGYDFRFVRTYWEVSSSQIRTTSPSLTYKWAHFAKGGAFSPYYYGLHLLMDWEITVLRYGTLTGHLLEVRNK